MHGSVKMFGWVFFFDMLMVLMFCGVGLCIFYEFLTRLGVTVVSGISLVLLHVGNKICIHCEYANVGNT